jgi:Leucine-rich repeat (LRR) protein
MPQPANRLATTAAIVLAAATGLGAPGAARADPALECTVEGKPGIRIVDRCIARDTTRLDLSYTRLSDLSPLAEMTELESLHVSFTEVSDLSPLAGLERLRGLSLYKTPVSDLSPLAGVPGLDLLTTPDGTPYVFNEIEQAVADWTP